MFDREDLRTKVTQLIEEILIFWTQMSWNGLHFLIGTQNKQCFGEERKVWYQITSHFKANPKLRILLRDELG